MNKEELTSLLQAATSYYNGRHTGMTDQQYDELLEKAKLEYPGFNIFDKIVIGGDRSTVKHSYPFTPQEFKLQFSDPESFRNLTKDLNSWTATPKWDGCSIRAYYSNGKLTDIITRSDENQGKRKFNQLKNKVPNEVNDKVICIDFEALCSREDFGDDSRSNANGLVNSCNIQDQVDKFLQLIPFKVTLNEKVNYLDAMKLVFNEGDFVIFTNIDATSRFIEYKGKHYPIDGYVFYSDTVTCHKIYKFYFNQVPISKVTKIHWNYTGNLCWMPKVLFNPVKIDGRTVGAASSNGLGRLKTLKCGVGSTVEIILANSTIPQIHKVLEPSEDYQLPTTCPFCGAPLAICCDKYRCTNNYCTNIINNFSNILLKVSKSPMVKCLSIDELKIAYSNHDKSIDKLQIIKDFILRLPIERFKKQKDLFNIISNNLNKVITDSTLSLNLWMFTYNQKEVYKHYAYVVDDIIRIINEE